MAASTQKVPYPDNLWILVFEDKQTVPADADETLALLRQSISRPLMQRVLDLRFKEGKTLAETGSIVGKSPEVVRTLIEKAIWKMQCSRYSYEREAELCFGIRIHKLIAEGTMGVCKTCGKLIEESAVVYIVPDYDSFMWASPDSPAWEMCCSRECAEAAIAEKLSWYKQEIKDLTQEILGSQKGIDGLEHRVQAIQKYKAESMTLKEAYDRIIACESAESGTANHSHSPAS